MTRKFAILCAIVVSLSVTTAHASEHVAPLTQLAKEKIMVWANGADVVKAVNAQNTKNASLGQDAIIKLDKEWRAEVKSGGGPLSKGILSNALSAYLKKIKADSKGLYAEIFVMDNKGVNVGQSDLTSDYWQGDEAKWQKSYQAGPGAIDIGKIEKDESSQTFQSQVSVTVVDPETKKAIGAVTIGINMDAL